MISGDESRASTAVPEAFQETRAPESLVIFTWNLKKREQALQLACRHLAGQGPFVAVLQELPEPRPDGPDIAMILSEQRIRCLSQAEAHKDSLDIIQPRVLILSSDDIEVDILEAKSSFDPQVEDKRRLEGLALRATTWQNLKILGVHGPDRVNFPSEKQRTVWGGVMRDFLNDFWPSDPLIVLGDMNADPWSPEITSRDGLFAIRKKDWPTEDLKPSHRSVKVSPLLNLMWRFLGDSFLYETIKDKKRKEDLLWHCFDQILVSPHLEVAVESLEILKDLGGVTITEEISDHLPVQMKMDIRKVKECQIS